MTQAQINSVLMKRIMSKKDNCVQPEDGIDVCGSGKPKRRRRRITPTPITSYTNNNLVSPIFNMETQNYVNDSSKNEIPSYRNKMLLQSVFNLSEGVFLVMGLDLQHECEPILKIISNFDLSVIQFSDISWKQFLNCKDTVLDYFTNDEWYIESLGFVYHKVAFSQTGEKVLYVTDYMSNSSVIFQKEVILALLKIDFFINIHFTHLKELKFYDYLSMYSKSLKEFEDKFFRIFLIKNYLILIFKWCVKCIIFIQNIILIVYK